MDIYRFNKTDIKNPKFSNYSAGEKVSRFQAKANVS